MKTIAVRLEEELYATLVIVGQLDGKALSEEIREAIEAHIAAKRAEGSLAGKAQEVLDDIDRQANERRAAIQQLLGKAPAAAAAPKAAAKPKPAGGRSGAKAGQ